MVNNNNKATFIVDSMLGNIAKKLRLMGFDSLYWSDIDDTNILDIAKEQNRIIITKDYQLNQSAIKQNIKSIFLSVNDEKQQFSQIKNKLALNSFIVDCNFALCSVCNDQLHLIEKQLILKQIPSGVAKNNDKFWKCSTCKKIYWQGTHIINLQSFVRSINNE